MHSKLDYFVVGCMVLYAVIALVTFGYAAANVPESCAKFPECAALTGIFSGVLWPFYWSWEFFIG